MQEPLNDIDVIMHDTTDSEAGMVSARSQVTLSATVNDFVEQDTLQPGFVMSDAIYSDEPSATSPTLDLLDRMRNTYRLLDLVSDTATGGSVDKVVIAQESIQRFANRVEPGSYASVTKVNFRALDKHIIRPRGVYGSISKLASFLEGLGCANQETARLLLTPRNERTASLPYLSPGLYLVDARSSANELFYVIFWPEDMTWDVAGGSAVARNRVTFMRYLTKLCDQLVCLIDDESAAKFVWKQEADVDLDGGYDVDEDERLYAFSVEQMQNQDESATIAPGFEFQHPLITEPEALPNGYPHDIPSEFFRPQIVTGDLSQGIMEVTYLKDNLQTMKTVQKHTRYAMSQMLRNQLKTQVQLSEHIDRASINQLLELGLGSQCGDAEKLFKAKLQEFRNKRDLDRTMEQNRQQASVESRMESLKNDFPYWLIRQALAQFPTINEKDLQQRILLPSVYTEPEDIAKAISNVDAFYELRGSTRDKALSNMRDALKKLDTSPQSRYNALKQQYWRISTLLESNGGLLERSAQEFVELILEDGAVFQRRLDDTIQKLTAKEKSGFFKRAKGWLTWSNEEAAPVIVDFGSRSPPDDIEFWTWVQSDVKNHAAFITAEHAIRAELLPLVSSKLQKVVNATLKNSATSLQKRNQDNLRNVYAARQITEESTLWDDFVQGLRASLDARLDSLRPCINISKVTQEGSRTYGYEYFLIEGLETQPKKADFLYQFYPINIRAEDLQQVRVDSTHVCHPMLSPRRVQSFSLRKGTQIRLFRLIGNDNCVVILENSVNLGIYFEPISTIGNAIETRPPRRQFTIERVGTGSMCTIDESRRLLAVLSRMQEALQIHAYALDESSRELYGRKTAINIGQWYPGGIPEFTHFLLVPGTEELLLVDRSGSCRVFSLATETFRSRKLQLEGPPKSVLVSPDGTCVLILEELGGSSRLRCFHWASFGENEGKELQIPDWITGDTPIALSSIGYRENCQIIFLRLHEKMCVSLALKITQKSSAFAFRQNPRGISNYDAQERSDNMLIDCHSEVWTRFPIKPPIHHEAGVDSNQRKRSIVFICDKWQDRYEPYFRSMVAEFEGRTRKPTDGLLKEIAVFSRQSIGRSDDIVDVSSFRLGDWLVGMFCLIPIHLAVTRSNRFVPLKDGLDSSEFERLLLGANVAQIAQELSFGWYESIFGSYLADKPVKVVTSMGEQSVGKSYALNHFVDTSFAGSAMRCTEGVWLSVTPTTDHLIVAMDFEGVQSIERSAQEDMLLVLLNTAISNFVLFRNNFAVSRDIAGLFTSFQSCISVLDPASNPTLFQSCLEIIIKDVISSDTQDMVKEFGSKFDRMVREEGADNFITQLHRGKLEIIPWPVIESSHFYKLFYTLKSRFMNRPVTHHHAGAFLVLLKTLMAKLKANDWGALDQNLATQRAHHLSTILETALCTGTSDPHTNEPLKNCDNDQPISTSNDFPVFYLPNTQFTHSQEPLTLSNCLVALRKAWPDRLQRYSMDERQYLKRYQDYLQDISSTRVALVQEWLNVNIARFGENAEIKALLRQFEDLAKELKSGVVICGATCSSCYLLCLDQRHHEGNHDCTTTHKCAKLCGFYDQHSDSEVPPCDLPAGHEGRHVCTTVEHLCGIPCLMEGKDGCLRKCSKPMDHEDTEHLCAARVHACGAPCDLHELIGTNGNPVCSRTCITDSRVSHERHCCERSMSCPIRCQLCRSYCAAGDHFHALEAGAVHLCGQEHRCRHECELPGICEIASAPQSIQTTFTGKYSTFEYTKYTQEARRLPCGLTIPPDQLDHPGMHVHTTEPDAFHFCEARCQHCHYYCTLPLGHGQDQHHTLHGSMEQTRWFVEGNGEAAVEIEGQRYATGDSGAPMLCSMVCKSMGRHVHIAPCRAEDATVCREDGLEHIRLPNEPIQKDWLSHKLYWARSGFEDPYTHGERAEFELCTRKCGGEEHDPAVNPGALSSYCTLPLFHPPADPINTPGIGHVSHDGHAYLCKNPALMQRSYHVFFALDRSGSMRSQDRRPPLDHSATMRIARTANNRYGAVLSAVYGFWLARDAAIRSAAAAGARRDAYTMVVFDSVASVQCRSDVDSDPDGLLDRLPAQATRGGTNFTHALQLIKGELSATWATERSPVVIFLSDGESSVRDETIIDLCNTSIQLGKPLAFHAISFGRDDGAGVLKRMATIAREIYISAPADPLSGKGPTPCAFHEALDTVQLADTFMNIAASLKNPRAALSHL